MIYLIETTYYNKDTKEAQKYIDWDDNVSCEYYPADGRGYKGNYDSNRERRSKTCLPQYLRKRR